MTRIVFSGMVYCALLMSAVRVVAQQANTPAPAPATTNASPHRALLNRYCVTCHSDKLRTAGLTLEKLNMDRVAAIAQSGYHPANGSASADTELYEKVLRKLRAGDMPPSGAPRPDQAASDALLQHLESELDRAAAASPNPGRTSLRRLNRTEYANAVRDLLGVEIDAAALLPSDDSRYGFDNNGDVLTLSPLLAERYLAVARQVRRLALGTVEAKPAVEIYDVSKYLMQDDRVDESLPFGSRGGAMVRHNFPADGEYEVNVRLQRNSRDYIRGMGAPHTLDLRLDGVRIGRFEVGGERHGKSSGIFSSASMGELPQEVYERTADEVLNLRFPAKAGAHEVAAAFVKEASIAEEPDYPAMTLYDYAQYKGGLPAVWTVSVGGPYKVNGLSETASRRALLSCPANASQQPNARQQDEACARSILQSLARRSYRRPVPSDEIETLMSFYREGKQRAGFEAGIGNALERMLAGPEFLFRIEADPPSVKAGSSYRVNDWELASRLSFFLWSSIPDEELLGLAEGGKLHEPAVLQAQVTRMLADARASSLVSNFASQWLSLRTLRGVSPDLEQFPYFDENLRQAFRQETDLFLESILREDHSVMDLLSADYTFVNERLAQHYGIPGIYGSHFRRVELKDSPRGGLLGQGSILTVTSYTTRTSPVVRGKWILNNLLGTPPPPPPPNVPELKDRNAAGKVLSMRQRMEQHRANPACAGCHKVMDPLGFALEKFDGIGHWRTIDSNTPIDSSGVLPDGTPFDGLPGLKKVLLEKRRDQFVATVTERLLTYALGRGVEYYDAPAIRAIMREAAAQDNRISSLIVSIVNSKPFQQRMK